MCSSEGEEDEECSSEGDTASYTTSTAARGGANGAPHRAGWVAGEGTVNQLITPTPSFL